MLIILFQYFIKLILWLYIKKLMDDNVREILIFFNIFENKLYILSYYDSSKIIWFQTSFLISSLREKKVGN